MKKSIIYLHGFNSASLDLSGKLLTTKQKLVVLDAFCKKQSIKLCTPNVDYRNFQQLIEKMVALFNSLQDEGYQVLFMGSSMGGFASEYLAMKLQTKAIMINPAISPLEILVQFIGVNENYETKQAYEWNSLHCEQYRPYQEELKQCSVDRTILLDMADELIDASETVKKYQHRANVVAYEGGSHGFEHMEEALPIINKVLFAASNE